MFRILCFYVVCLVSTFPSLNVFFLSTTKQGDNVHAHTVLSVHLAGHPFVRMSACALLAKQLPLSFEH